MLAVCETAFSLVLLRDVQRDRMVKHTAWLHGIREQLRT
jgi:hypothetical protein